MVLMTLNIGAEIKTARKKCKVLMQLGSETVIGFGADHTVAMYDALLSLLQTTSYKFTTKRPVNVIPGDSQCFVSSPTSNVKHCKATIFGNYKIWHFA